MPTISTIPTVKTELVTVLQARAGLSGVQVAREWPGDAVEAEAIWIGNVDFTHRIAAMKAGRKPRDEEYRLEVIISVLKDGVQDAEERALALFGELESLLAEEPQISVNTGINWAVISDSDRSELNSGRTPQGGLGQIRVFIEVSARLT